MYSKISRAKEDLLAILGYGGFLGGRSVESELLAAAFLSEPEPELAKGRSQSQSKLVPA